MNAITNLFDTLEHHGDILSRSESGEYIEQSTLDESQFIFDIRMRFTNILLDWFDKKISDDERDSLWSSLQKEQMQEWWQE